MTESTASARSAHVNAIVDQMAGVADHYLTTQTARAKRLLQQCAEGKHSGESGYVEEWWVGWNEGLSDLTQAWFSWVQLFDALAEDCCDHSGTSKPGQGKTPVEGVFVKEVTVAPQPQDTPLSTTDFKSVDEISIPAASVTVDPPTVAANTETTVTVTVTPPSNTPTNVYHGSITGPNGGAIADVEILVIGP
jgi:hypothetical protein